MPNEFESSTPQTGLANKLVYLRYWDPARSLWTNVMDQSGNPVTDYTDSWSMIFDPNSPYCGQMSMLDDQRETLGAALMYLGYSLNDTDPAHLEEAKNLLKSLGPSTFIASGLQALAARLRRGRAADDFESFARRAYGGLAPITRRSGKGRLLMRHACNTRLRSALYHWPRAGIQSDEGARIYYAALRARGHSHARALRSVADRWLRTLGAMLRSRTLYDPELPQRHEAPAAA